MFRVKHHASRRRTICAMLVVFSMAFFFWSVRAEAKIPVILSTDVGNEVDDQWAIAYLLVNPGFDVLGIVSAQAPSVAPPSAHPEYRYTVEFGAAGRSGEPPEDDFASAFVGGLEPLA